MYQSKYLKEEEKKSGSNKTLVIILAVLVILGGIAVWFFSAHVILDGEIYPKNSDFLNLRGEIVTFEHYDALREKLPGRRIYWDIPFQSGRYTEDTTELTVTDLTQEDVDHLAYFFDLETLHAENCERYDLLQQAQTAYPQINVLYTVTIDGVKYAQDASELTVSNLTDEEVTLAGYLPKLKAVDATACHDYAQLAALQQSHPECQITYNVVLGEESYGLDTKELNLTDQSLAELMERLAYLPQVEKIHLVDPEGGAEEMEALLAAYPNVTITSELVGVTVSEDGLEVDLSAVTLTALEDVDKYMAFYPNAERVYLGQPAFENEAIAAYRESKRADYKVVWTVMCGTIATRTDTDYFHPIQEYVFYFFDEDAYNLRYCEDIVALDLGHMPIHKIDFVKFMPNLKYLILAITNVIDISDLSTCKNLLFLEIDHTGVQDYSPLQGCTSLEDLNIGDTYGKIDPLLEMTWLKNIWCMERGGGTVNKMREALPDTNIVFALKSTTGGGWRQLQNYYDMRDVLHMPYMR